MKTSFDLKTYRTFVFLAIVVLFAGTFSSCKKSTPVVTPASALNIINAAETAPAQDFYVDDTKANATPLAFTQSTGYLTVSGSHICGFKTASDGTVNNSFPVSFDPGVFYSVYYVDDKSAVGVEDDKTIPQVGKARVRFSNLSTVLTSNIDVYISGGAALVSGVLYEDFSDYYEVNSSTQITITAAGSTAPLVNIPGIVLQSGKIYTIYLAGATALSYHVVAEN